MKITALVAGALLLIASGNALTNEKDVPAPFRGDDPNSTLSIGYADLNAFLKPIHLILGHRHEQKLPTQILTWEPS